MTTAMTTQQYLEQGRTTMTPSEIKSAYYSQDSENRHFFDRGTMKWFGDKMKSFGTKRIDGAIYLYRKPTAYVNVFGKWQVAGRQFFNAWYFDQQTGDLHRCNDDQTETVFNHIAGKSYAELA